LLERVSRRAAAKRLFTPEIRVLVMFRMMAAMLEPDRPWSKIKAAAVDELYVALVLTTASIRE
jgi:hypothetical protein